MDITNSQRETRHGSGLFSYGEIKQSSELQGVVVFGMENGGSGLKGLAGDGDSGHAATNHPVSLEDSDLTNLSIVGVRIGVVPEEVSYRRSADAAADYANTGR